MTEQEVLDTVERSSITIADEVMDVLRHITDKHEFVIKFIYQCDRVLNYYVRLGLQHAFKTPFEGHFNIRETMMLFNTDWKDFVLRVNKFANDQFEGLGDLQIDAFEKTVDQIVKNAHQSILDLKEE
jgi:hypothetical protein